MDDGDEREQRRANDHVQSLLNLAWGSSRIPDDTEPGEALGRFVRECREALQLTQKEASDQADLSKTTWQQIEWGQGEGARNLTLHAVARVIHVEPGVLINLRDGVVSLPEAETFARSREEVVASILHELEWLRMADLFAIEEQVKVRAELRRRQRTEPRRLETTG